MSKCNHPPIINNNGASFKDLYDQYRIVLGALKETENLACKAFPHGRDFQTSRDPNAADKARAEFRTEVYDKIAQAKEYVRDLLLDIARQHDEREAYKRPRLVPAEPEAHIAEAHNVGAFNYAPAIAAVADAMSASTKDVEAIPVQAAAALSTDADHADDNEHPWS